MRLVEVKISIVEGKLHGVVSLTGGKQVARQEWKLFFLGEIPCLEAW